MVADAKHDLRALIDQLSDDDAASSMMVVAPPCALPVTVYLVDDALIDAWAYVTAVRDRQGRPIATGDAWIAATAWVQGLPLVTHNRRHFAGIEGLEVVSAQL